MASYLCDTNLLLRLVDAPSPQHPIAAGALARLFREGHEIFITAQNLVEFWAVATRPVEANGLGWSPETTFNQVVTLQQKFPLLADSPGVFAEWLTLVREFSVSGKRVHDARLVAVLNANQIVTRTMISEHVWNEEFHSLSNVIDVHIRYLRNKIDDGFKKKLIHTIRGTGYMLKG